MVNSLLSCRNGTSASDIYITNVCFNSVEVLFASLSYQIVSYKLKPCTWHLIYLQVHRAWGNRHFDGHERVRKGAISLIT